MSSVYLFASGKGGVGKSTVTANLASLLARSGRRVALIDADIGLRSLDTFLGMENRVVYDLVDAARGECLLSQALLSDLTLPGLHLLPAAQFARAKELDPKAFRNILSQLRQSHDFILIDCPAGVERGLRNVLKAGADETVLLTTPDDLCIRDAERTCALMDKKRLPRPRLIVNRLQNDLIYTGDMYSAKVVSETLDLPLLGEIPEDGAMTLAQLHHRLVIDYRCEARQALLRIAGRMNGASVALPAYGKEKTSFFRRHFPLRPVEDPLRSVRLGAAPFPTSDPVSAAPGVMQAVTEKTETHEAGGLLLPGAEKNAKEGTVNTPEDTMNTAEGTAITEEGAENTAEGTMNTVEGTENTKEGTVNTEEML